MGAEWGSPRMPIEWLENEIPGNGKDDNNNGFIDEDISWFVIKIIFCVPSQSSLSLALIRHTLRRI